MDAFTSLRVRLIHPLCLGEDVAMMEAKGSRTVMVTSPRTWTTCLTALLLCVVPLGAALAGTTGTISGTVLDEAGQPVVAATLRVEGTAKGAYSGGDGRYSILQVPPGIYELSCKRLGFEPVLVQRVRVTADETTRIDVNMSEATIEVEEVVVTAQRPPVDLGLTSSKETVTAEEIEELPVQNLDEIVNLQAGVVEGHFRGGRQGEVQYQVDGVSVNNAFDNKSSVSLDRSLLQEVQVISGTFDAEYGQAMSGVVNAVLKSGTPEFEWRAEAYTGDFVFPDQHERNTEDELDLTAIQNYQMNISGPLPVPDTVYLLSGRRYVWNDYLYGDRVFSPFDDSDFANNDFDPSGDGESLPLGGTREWSGVLKLTNTSFDNSRLNYQVIASTSEGKRSEWAYRLLPDGRTTQNTTSVSHGLDWTQTFGSTTFLDFNFRQNYRDYTDYAYEDLFDSRYDQAGQLETDPEYEEGAFIQGVNLSRYKQFTNSFIFKTAVTSQLDPVHQAKVGVELELPKVSFGSPGYLVYTQQGGELTLTRVLSDEDRPGVQTFRPMIGALYAQDSMEWDDLTLRAGLRLDYFNARSNLPSDLRNPANSIDGAPESLPRSTTAKTALSPRLGVAYPIEDYASIHVAYGHFRQFPAIGEMFNNSNYGVLRQLQAGDEGRFGVLGNPDVEPEKTVQYEIGYKHALSQDLGVEFTAFYKDIRDLLGVEFVTTYTGAQYARLTNVDFGNVLGFTVALDDRALGPASLSLDYTWQQALGNASDPRETANRAQADEDPRPRLLPFNWDQRHTLNATISIGSSDDILVSSILRVASGQPYTPTIDNAFNSDVGTNSDRKPTSFLMDLRAERRVFSEGVDAKVFARVFNVFDSRFFNGFVFDSTGSPYYSRFPTGSDELTLADPTRFYPPRRIEFGITFGTGQ